ncbi:hypothetical protein [Bradyrhizobium ottawaense]|uniref:hypothetical protein n=1 Tax=Bradyrhizobium ottawaense TaxID=931866 RepID=UPI00115F8B8E|nr:hypothetical protein [Bradyrhizobium ottawaense]
MSVDQLRYRRVLDEESLKSMREALALGDIAAVEEDVADALAAFGINLAPGSPSYPALGIAVLRACVRALQALEQRNAGEPVETPKFAAGLTGALEAGGTLQVAFEGWEKARERPTGTISEYWRAVTLFIELHGDPEMGDYDDDLRSFSGTAKFRQPSINIHPRE